MEDNMFIVNAISKTAGINGNSILGLALIISLILLSLLISPRLLPLRLHISPRCRQDKRFGSNR